LPRGDIEGLKGGEGGLKKAFSSEAKRSPSGWIKILFLLLFFFIISGKSFASEYLRVEGVIHLDTNIGGGTFAPEEMVKRVRDAGLKVAVITDHDNMRVEYGLPLLRKIIKKSVDKGGIKEYGSKRYIEAIEVLRHRYKDILILHGAETVPFYYWEGSPIRKDLTLKNWHKHMLVLGLKNPEDYDGIPSVGFGFPVKFSPNCIMNLWPVVLFIPGLILLRKKGEKFYHFRSFIIKKKKKSYFISGIIILSSGTLLLINNFPFCEPLYDQYHGDKGTGPYQFLIDYANEKGALTFWAHPEVESSYKEKAPFGRGIVKLYTPPYYNDLVETRGYTGFAVFEEGYRLLGRPGGLWDRILKEYCEGKRNSPVWVIGELDYKEGDWMGMTQTVFFLRSFNEEEVLQALRTGRVYAVRGKDKPILEDFSLRSSQGKVLMGEQLLSKDGVEVSIRLKFPETLKGQVKVFLVRNGEIIETFLAKGDSLINDPRLSRQVGTGAGFRDSFLIKYKDDYFKAGERIYYRVMVGGGAIHELPLLITNPIFVRFER
jgi:hypothetical protein